MAVIIEKDKSHYLWLSRFIIYL